MKRITVLVALIISGCATHKQSKKASTPPLPPIVMSPARVKALAPLQVPDSIRAVIPTSANAFQITNQSQAKGAQTIAWQGGSSPFMVQRKVRLTDAWTNVAWTTDFALAAPVSNPAFYRIQSQFDWLTVTRVATTNLLKWERPQFMSDSTLNFQPQRSTDGGATWTTIETDPPTQSSSSDVHAVPVTYRVLCNTQHGAQILSDVVSLSGSSPGTVEWLLGIGGTSGFTDYCDWVVTDSSGNLYVAGRISSPTVDFGGGVVLNGTGNGRKFNGFIAKYSPSGVISFAKVFASGTGTIDLDSPVRLAVDNAGNIIVTGSFSGGSMDFGWGASTASVNHDLFIAKYDANGNHFTGWSQIRFVSGPMSSGTIGAAVNSSGDIAVCGWANASTDFGLGMQFCLGDSYQPPDIFCLLVSHLDGHTVWAHFYGIIAAGGSKTELGIAIDSNDDIVMTGGFNVIDFTNTSSPIPFPRPSTTMIANGGESAPFDIFVFKCASATGAFGFQHQFGGGQADKGTALAVDSARNIFIAGIFGTQMDMGVGAMTTTLGFDLFLAKLNPIGTCLWSRNFKSYQSIAINGIAVDASGDPSICGFTDRLISFDGMNTVDVSVQGPTGRSAQETPFVAKYGGSASGVNPANLQWYQVMSEVNGNEGHGLTVDPGTSKRITCCGWFSNTASLGNKNISTPGGVGMFIGNFDP